MRKNKVLYKIIVEDINNVSEEVLNRKLTDSEIKKVENRIGDYINWYDAIENTFSDLGLIPKNEEEDD